MSFGGAQFSQFLALQARVKALEGLGLDTITAAGLALLDDASASAQLTTLGVSTFIKTLLDDADAATARTTLGLGSAATKELTSWTLYTPTLTGFGTPSNVSIRSMRAANCLLIGGKFTIGTATAVEARMTLGFNGVNGGITSDATLVPSIELAGIYGENTSTGAFSGYTLIESNVGYITFAFQNAGSTALTKQTGSGIGSTKTLSILAEVPISGW